MKQAERQRDCLDGRQLREMLASGTAWLEKCAPDIDAINVFPVPDGDTGTNMLLTMRSAMEECYRAPDGSASAVCQALSHGALMGARGNSGVILSQFFRGVARAVQASDYLSPTDLAAALREAAEQAYEGIAKPAEGTMLTVMRDAAKAAAQAAQATDASLVSVTEAAVQAARESVSRTPSLLPALWEAGVVDAGGQGIFVILEGALHHLKGELEELKDRKPALVPSAVPLALRTGRLSPEREEAYGYCTEFIIEGEQLNQDRVMAYLKKKGQSVVVVGDQSMMRVHVHTLDPGVVLSYGRSKGTLHQISIENMDDQNREFARARKAESETGDIAVVAVALGEGFAEVLKSLGVARVVDGGQTMNPSVRDLLKAVEGVSAEKVIVLPNNKNIIASADRLPELTAKKVAVVPTTSLPQGIGAQLSFNCECDFEPNVEAMRRACQCIKTVEITKAVRNANLSGVQVKKGQIIGLVDDVLAVAGDDVDEVLGEALAKAGAGSAEVVTLYYGAGVTASQAEEAVRVLSAASPGVQFEAVRGAQPHYYYIVSLE